MWLGPCTLCVSCAHVIIKKGNDFFKKKRNNQNNKQKKEEAEFKAVRSSSTAVDVESPLTLS